jgi:hypothetical protein
LVIPDNQFHHIGDNDDDPSFIVLTETKFSRYDRDILESVPTLSQRRVDVEVRSYLRDQAGSGSLVFCHIFNLSITHDRFGSSKTILLFHIISARPSKQPLMVRTFLKVYMEIGSYFCFCKNK